VTCNKQRDRTRRHIKKRIAFLGFLLANKTKQNAKFINLWDFRGEKCVAAWKVIKQYASVVGMKFNEDKTGSACQHSVRGIRWGLRKFDSHLRRSFANYSGKVGRHVVELHPQLSATRSLWLDECRRQILDVLHKSPRWATFDGPFARTRKADLQEHYKIN
jgi:hypothetical protein